MKTLLIGSLGKMAQAILKGSKEQIKYTYLLDINNKNNLTGEIKTINHIDKADPKNIDLVIDFGTKNALLSSLSFCKKYNKKRVEISLELNFSMIGA